MKFLKVIGSIAVLIVLVRFGAGFLDGPVGIIAGGPFSSGQEMQGDPDWSEIANYETVEMQLLHPAASRTTWFAVHDNRLFIPSGYMTTWWGKIWKQWPIHAERDGRAILRVDGVVYTCNLVRIMDSPVIAPVLAELGRKYGDGGPFPRELFDSDYLWLFEITRG